MIRKGIIILLTLGVVGSCGLWLAAYTVVGQEFEEYEDIHGVSVTFRHSNGTWGFAATDFSGELVLIIITRIDDSLVVPERLYGSAGFHMQVWAYQEPPWGRILSRSFTMPLWAPPLLFAIYPAIAFIRGPLRRWRRHKKGLCLRCGYDLTGNVSGVCPECGVAV
jgi:hypothetical protein